MAALSYIVLFVLPIMAFIAIARLIDEESPWSKLDFVIFCVALLGFGAAILVFIDS